MTNKKYDIEEIKRAVIRVYNSIEAYAEFKKTSKQNIYEKIRNQSNKFLKELEDDGIQIDNFTGTLDLTQIKEDMTKLKADMYDLQHEIKNKDERINELEAENDQLRVEVAALLAKYKPKLKR